MREKESLSWLPRTATNGRFVWKKETSERQRKILRGDLRSCGEAKRDNHDQVWVSITATWASLSCVFHWKT